MIWLTWRQHRAQLLTTAALLLLIGTGLLVHGLGTADLRAGLSGPDLDNAVGDHFQSAYQLLGWLPVLPGIVGLFWGAPLVSRELERGTHRLAWTQSVTRSHWLAAKLGGLGLVAAAAGLAVGFMVDSWLSTFEGSRFDERIGDAALFGSSGVVAGAWWLFAFMLGAAVGAVARKLLPALAVTAALYFLTMYLFFDFRGDYAEPVRVVGDTVPAGLVTGSAWLAPDGAEVAQVPQCANASRDDYVGCVKASDYRSVLYVQPESRYWQFQWTEAGILLAASLMLGAVVVHRVARKGASA
jgi:hypothetical protein